VPHKYEYFTKALANVVKSNLHLPGAYSVPFRPRIVGGEDTTIEEYPHQVSVIYIDSHYCGGSILNPTHILTAAHCTDQVPAEDLMVRAGSSMIDEGGQVRQVLVYFQHTDFDSDTYDYDISVLRLSQSLEFGSGVNSIQLPEKGADVGADICGTATGWGRLSENGPLPMQLQKVDLPTLDQQMCILVYGNKITDRMFCAGYVAGLKDTCQGDSGGPLIDGTLLLGITSWGDGCGAANSPGVYTKVSYFKDYIDAIIN
jgi:secreted trypsin-like serine protease